MRNKSFVKAFILAICLMLFQNCLPVFASDGGENVLTVKAAWTDGDMLRIDVTNADGQPSALALRLADYIDSKENSEYISVQAVDTSGNQSGVIKIKNPYYVPPKTSETETTPKETAKPTQPTNTTQSVIANSTVPLTPKGPGTVMDNAKEGDGKEFFTINTEDGNIFYLIVDRQKNTDNVYLLNAVSEDDLAALAEKSSKTTNGGTSSAIITPSPTPTPSVELTTPTKGEEKPPVSNENNGFYIIIIIVAVAVAAAGYYFKVVKVKDEFVEEDDELEFEDEYSDEELPEDEIMEEVDK